MALKMMSSRTGATARNVQTRAVAQGLSSSDLAKFKIVDLVEIAAKKGVSPGRNATRDSVTRALISAGVSTADLTKGQLFELGAAAPVAAASYGSSSAATSSGDRWANVGRSSSAAPARGGAGGDAKLSAGDLSAFKIVDLVEIAQKKGVAPGRDATRDSVTRALVSAGVALSDLSRGQLGDLGIKLGKAGLSRDIKAARAELAGLIGGSGSAGSSWEAAPAPTGGRFSSYSSPAPSRSAAPARGGSSGAKLSAGDLAIFKIDDLRDLVSKTGAELPREPTKDSVISALLAKGASLDHCTRGMLVDLATKLGAPLAKDVAGLKAGLSSLVGGGGGSSGGSSSSWRSTPAPAAAAPAAAGGDRWAKYSAGSTQAASWRRSGSHNASGSKLSAGDLNILRIDDLADLVKKTGAEVPRERTKDAVISALVSKGVSLNELTRGMLVDLANKLGQPLAKDVDSLRKNLASAVGKSGGYSSAPAASASSWRSTPAAPAASSSNGSGDRWASYSRSSGSSSSYGSSASGGSDTVFEADLRGFKVDTLSELARKKGIAIRNATKDSLVSSLMGVLSLKDLSRGQLAEILSNIGESASGSVDAIRAKVASASSARQSARAPAGARR